MSKLGVQILLVEYVILVLLSFVDKKYDLCLYWAGAAILNLGVLRMGY